jgi:hypothetical protein
MSRRIEVQSLREERKTKSIKTSRDIRSANTSVHISQTKVTKTSGISSSPRVDVLRKIIYGSISSATTFSVESQYQMCHKK